MKDPKVTVLDTKTWKIVKEIPTLGPGFFMRSHEKSPYAWVDVFFGERDAHLEVVRRLETVNDELSAHELS